MSAIPLNIARVSMQMQGSLLLGNLQAGQLSLLQVEQQLSTGNQLNLPSDNPTAAVGIIGLKHQIADSKNYTTNLNFASGMLGQADSALGSLSSLITQAQSIASSQVSTGVTADQRAAQAQVIDSILSQAMDLANSQYQGQSVFGGQNGSQNAFSSVAGGYLYQGTAAPQTMLTPSGGSIQYTLTGDTAFGAISSQVMGYQDITPTMGSGTRLSDLAGAQLHGISPAPVNITLGSTTISVDLSTAATVGDVLNTVNTALASAGSDGSIAISGGLLQVNGDSTQAITISDPTGSHMAADLGLAGATAAAGTNAVGSNLAPRITGTTPLAALRNGAGVDPAGFTITNGANSATISLAGMSTVQDLLNAINSSGTHVQASINAAGNGINLLNPVSGTALRIGENGGNTADQLGIRSFNATTKLAGFNGGSGVTPISASVSGPTGQILVTKTDGTQFAVQVNGLKTPSQLVAAINAATGNGSVTAALNATGNGITLTDSSGGAGNLTVAAGANYVSNNTDLGLFKTGAGNILAGGNITLSTDDFRVARRDGTSFTVNLTGATSVQDVLNRINNADGNTNPATQVTAALNPTGNGIQLSDASSGSGSLTVTALNSSQAATQLGIAKTAAAATPAVIHGDDTNPLQPQGIFTTLTMLRDALLNNDTAGITQAGALLSADSSRAIRARGVVGAREQDVANRKTDESSRQTQLAQALMLLNDTDFTTAATRLQQLQTAYQASLQVAQMTQNMNLMNFLK